VAPHCGTIPNTFIGGDVLDVIIARTDSVVASGLGWPEGCQSKTTPSTRMNGPRIDAGAGDPTHRCGHGNIRRRIAETWVIRHIEELGAELRGDPLADFRRLQNAHVEKLLLPRDRTAYCARCRQT